MKKTYFFYDLETSGLSPREDRIMQFAGQRTDEDLNPLGDPVNILVKTGSDTLPSPFAVAVTGITPQSTQADGLTEAEFCKYVQSELFVENTVAIGYNSVRFDDEFMRHTFWRNFYDPYEWQWRDGRSRWDMLDIVRLVRALRPEGINWPVREDGIPTNRLELLTKMNNISHEHAHDALADVYALIAVTKLIKDHQPRMFDYLYGIRDKKSVKSLVSPEAPAPFVYASGRYPSKYNHTTVAVPVAPGKNGTVLVYDLRNNLEELLSKPEEISEHTGKPKDKLYPAFKILNPGRCPAVAPLSVLDAEIEGKTGWQKLDLTKDQIEKNLEILHSHPEVISERYEKEKAAPEWPAPFDPESALYDGFVPDSDKVRISAVRNADARSLADFSPNFQDSRLSDLLVHYKARNFPSSLTASESESWEAYRISRLQRQEPEFIKGLEAVSKMEGKSDIVEELKLWYQSLAPEC